MFDLDHSSKEVIHNDTHTELNKLITFPSNKLVQLLMDIPSKAQNGIELIHMNLM